MSGMLPLLACIVGVVWLAWRDVKERRSVSSAAWIVIAWGIIYGSRPVTSWFSGPDQSAVLPEAYDEGNLAEALVYVSVITAGMVVLLRRGITFPAVIKENRWLFAFYLFWLLSVVWSDYPVITMKRWIKDLGNVVMVLVILSEREPGQAVRAVISRLAYVCISLSIVLIRYYPDWGRAYGGYNRSELMYVGVTTHKNSLGALALVAALFILWDLVERGSKTQSRVSKLTFAGRAAVLLMCWHLLMLVDSATSLVCAVVGSVLIVVLGFPGVRRRYGRVEAWGLGLVVIFVILDWTFNVKEAMVTTLGRDMTLTTRTDIWPILMASQDNALLGAGFNSFWAGRRLVLLGERVGSIIQAHNGYLETYLNGGVVGVGVLTMLLFSAYRRVRKRLVLGVPEGSIRLVILVLAIIHNFSEASFNKVSVLWFVTMFAVMEYRARPGQRLVVAEKRAWRAAVAAPRP